MKKYIFIPVLFLLVSISVQAQVGVGARGIFGVDGNAYGGLELSIQKPNVYEIDFGVMNESWKATGLRQVGLIDHRSLGVYLGGGLGIGYYNPSDEVFGTFALNVGSYLMLGRIQLGLDWRPEWNFFNAPGNDLSFNTALSARWMFR